MGLRILQPDSAIIVLDPFKKGSSQRTVQLWYNFHSNLHNLEFRKPVKSKNQATEFFVVEFAVETFRQISKTAGPSLRAYSQQLKKQTTLLYSPKPIAMDAEMHQNIYRIMHYKGDEELKPMYVYAQVIGLLISLQLNYKKTKRTLPVYIKNEYDKERILYARDYLITHMDAPPSLIQLAAIAGINEFKLKRGFKEMFNHTPFGYLSDVRLEMARTALQQKQKTVTQIAFELGYASLQHFSAAFKKKFKVSPARFEQ
jgi:AraC-like DNA-binding protein